MRLSVHYKMDRSTVDTLKRHGNPLKVQFKSVEGFLQAPRLCWGLGQHGSPPYEIPSATSQLQRTTRWAYIQ